MRSRLRVGIGLVVAIVVAATAPGAGAPAAPVAPVVAAGVRTQLGAGLSVAVPAGWSTARHLTALAEPYERFTLASFPVRQPPQGGQGCGPDAAVAAMPADGALAFVIEYAPRGISGVSFPPQPRHFALPAGQSHTYDCFPRGWLLRFRAGPRRFQVMIALGRRASRNRALLLRALSSLRVA